MKPNKKPLQSTLKFIKLWLKKSKNKKIKKTVIVGTYTGKQIIMAKDNFQKIFHVSI